MDQPYEVEITKAIMPDGQTYKFAPAGFSREVVELIEMLEIPEAAAKSPGRIMRMLHGVVTDCMVRGGHTADEAEGFLRTIPLKNMEPFIEPLRAAIGIE